jgi:hypothetical protein
VKGINTTNTGKDFMEQKRGRDLLEDQTTFVIIIFCITQTDNNRASTPESNLIINYRMSTGITKAIE